MTLLAEGLDNRQRRTAQAVATELSDALAVPPPPELGDDRSPSSPRWRGQSLSKGAAGVAVLHGMRAHGEPDGERLHAWLACAAREDLSAGPGAGLWFGAPAVAFAVSTAAPGQYPRVMKSLDAAVSTLVRARLEVALARLAAATRPSLSEFDLVRGLTGLGAYLLRRDPHGELVRRVLTYLVRLTQPVPADDAAGLGAPGWWTSDVPSGQPADAFRGGHADLGMAHGIAGPLALLALAMKQGITVDGHADAIEGICHWLNTWRHEAPTGPWWPERVSLTELRTGRSVHNGPALLVLRNSRPGPRAATGRPGPGQPRLPADGRTFLGPLPVRSRPTCPHHRPRTLPRLGGPDRDSVLRRRRRPFPRHQCPPATSDRHIARARPRR